MTENSKIGDEFEQNKLSELCVVEIIVRIHPLSWSCQSNLHLRSAIKNISQPLDGTYLADFGIDIKANLPKKNEERGQELGQKLSDFDFL